MDRSGNSVVATLTPSDLTSGIAVRQNPDRNECRGLGAEVELQPLLHGLQSLAQPLGERGA
jgi:hypothetical protein